MPIARPTFRPALLLVLLCLAACGRDGKPADQGKEAAVAQEALPTVQATFEVRARRSIELFRGYQKSQLESLKRALTTGGTAEAVEVCRTASERLTRAFADLPGVSVRRISDRSCNPAHKPDAFEEAVFAQWHQQVAKGETPAAIARETEDGRLRVLQPVFIGARLCLRCHGKRNDMTKEAFEFLDKAYPNGQGTGYGVGDLRGAYSATWPPQ